MVNKSVKNASLVFLSIILCVLNTQAQSNFKLYKSEGHFYFNGQMNETRVDSILLETGCRYIMCNESFFNEICKTAAFVPDSVEFSHAKSYRKDYAVQSVHRGRIKLGDFYYEDKIIVLKDFKHLLLPIHLLRQEYKDETQELLICLNFEKLTMDFVSSNEINLNDKNTFRIVELLPRPVIEASLEIKDEKRTIGEMTARLNFDLGSGNYISLFGGHPKVANWIRNTEFWIKTTYHLNGKKAGKGIFATKCSVGELNHKNIPINILNWSVKDMDGLIGPSFFGNRDVYLDSSKGLIYY
jgi:hypothetical protein